MKIQLIEQHLPSESTSHYLKAVGLSDNQIVALSTILMNSHKHHGLDSIPAATKESGASIILEAKFFYGPRINIAPWWEISWDCPAIYASGDIALAEADRLNSREIYHLDNNEYSAPLYKAVAL